ncbi:MAG: TatD family hydrolase [Candidatus Obscuribacterales bacterium]|nr:TatD family hydrolase [Steroidobacteraceae bacterium]
MLTSLVDIGVNLTHESFDHDRDALLQSAAEVGVAHMIVTGSSVASSLAAIELVKKHPNKLRATAGIHPHYATDFNESHLDSLRHLLRQSEIIASGECGLDYFRNLSPQVDQERAFRLQLELACEIGKPLFLHQRDAHDPFLSILREYWPRLQGGVAHCFTGNRDEARAYLDLGLFIGITGWICDERRGTDLREVVRFIPSDRLLVETDAPYLLPRNLRPKPSTRRNEPMYLFEVVKTLAACRDEPVAALAAATIANTHALFGWPTAN